MDTEKSGIFTYLVKSNLNYSLPTYLYLLKLRSKGETIYKKCLKKKMEKHHRGEIAAVDVDFKNKP